MADWVISQSAIPSDIIWRKFGQKKPHDNINDILLNLLMLFLTIIFCAPNNNAYMLLQALNRLGITGDILNEYQILNKFIKIGSIAFLNSFLIPQLVFNLTQLMFFETESAKDKSKLRKYFFFLFTNAIILPLTQFDQILDFVNALLTQQGMNKISEKIG